MTALVTKEDIEGVLLRPLSDTENKYFEQLLQQVTETLETLLDVKMRARQIRRVYMRQLAAHVS